MIPAWLHELSIAYLWLGAISAVVLAIDVSRRAQRMWIMNLVWPLSALFGTVLVAWLYFSYGRLSAAEAAGKTARRHQGQSTDEAPLPISVATASLHCGSGCALGDLCAEWLVFAVPPIAMAFGWHTLFAEKMFAVWIIDYLFAFAFGILFQYWTIVPMRNLSVGAGLIAALKADTLSLTAWQVGMYALMAVANFWLFGDLLGVKLRTNSAEFWFTMQLAMICGFVTSYPVNWWLVSRGIKERM